MSQQADQVWSTAGFAADVKMRRWTELVSENMTEMIVSSDDPETYRAHWRQYDLDGVRLNFIASGMQHCLRSPQMIPAGAAPTYELVYVRAGRIAVSTFDRREEVPSGCFTLLRNEEPYEFWCEEATLALTAHFDDAWLRRWLGHHENFTQAPHEIRRAWGAPLAALLETIAREGLDEAMVPRSTIADQIDSLFALMGRPASPTARPGARALLAAMRRTMEERLTDNEFDPQDLAEACGVSKRYVHSVFARAGTTFGRELIELRLRRARQLLSDPRFRSWSISQIALECGFSDQSHFSRRFRKRFDAAPSSCRELVQTAP